jgi:hypothetical protein
MQIQLPSMFRSGLGYEVSKFESPLIIRPEVFCRAGISIYDSYGNYLGEYDPSSGGAGGTGVGAGATIGDQSNSSFGGSGGTPTVNVDAMDTSFSRSGTTNQQRQPSGSWPSSNVTSALSDWVVTQPEATSEQTALNALLKQSSTVFDTKAFLSSVLGLPQSALATVNLSDIYTLDPFGNTYEVNTLALYTRQYLIARAAAQSGPTNVRGGTARQGFELAELDTLMAINQFREIWQNQVKVAQVVVEAASAADAAWEQLIKLQLEAQKQQAATEQGLVMQTLAAAEQLTKDKEVYLRAISLQADANGYMVTSELLTGHGFQGGTNTGFGMSTWR